MTATASGMIAGGTTFALTGVSKRFGDTRAVRDVSLRVSPGTIHVLLGENGAGKSTLLRVAFGLISPDSGKVEAGSPPRHVTNPRAAIAAGLGMVHQHFTNVPAMTVAENVALGRHGAFREREAAAAVLEIGRRTGLALDPDALAGGLSVGAQQRLEIVKALSSNATTLLMDEPTAVLAPSEATDLLKWLRTFADAGNGVVLVTHRLREALSVADDVTVLRNGSVTMTAPASSVGEASVAAALLGEQSIASLGDAFAKQLAQQPATSNVVAELRNVSVVDERGVTTVRDVDLEIRGGEILGVAAVEGSGQHELLRVLAARMRPTRGIASLPASIGFIPEDRQRDALILDFTLAENLTLHDAGSRTGRIRWPAERERGARLLRAFDVRARDASDPARALSGGNQQKVVLARELRDSPALLVAENPTRGLDIRATRDVHRRLRDAAGAGMAVVVHSSDLDEILALADRVAVMHAGASRVIDGDRDAIGRAMLGVT